MPGGESEGREAREGEEEEDVCVGGEREGGREREGRGKREGRERERERERERGTRGRLSCACTRSAHCSLLCSVLCALRSALCSLLTALCSALCSVLCALCSVLCAHCSLLSALCSLLCSVLCALCSVLCALCSALRRCQRLSAVKHTTPHSSDHSQRACVLAHSTSQRALLCDHTRACPTLSTHTYSPILSLAAVGSLCTLRRPTPAINEIKTARTLDFRSLVV
eukprot:3941969-Rhodomonas_salina.1